MPLYKEWSTDAYTLAAIWKIGEPESFFRERTGVDTDIRVEKRRLEYLTGRFLLKHLEEDFPLLNIRPDDQDKPRIDENRFYFSISHSYPYVAAAVSPYVECGIDIQVWHPRMTALQKKFLSEREQGYFLDDPRLITQAWCAKEAAYKWQGRRGVEFIDHLPIVDVSKNENILNMSINLQLTTPKMLINAESFTGKDFACAYVRHSVKEHPIFS